MKQNNISLEDFLKLRINFSVQPVIDEEYGEEGYIITSSELPGIKVFGETMDQAHYEFEEAKIAWYEMKESLEEEILLTEEPKQMPSGRLTARFPVMLHQKIIAFAEENKTSVNSALNQLVNSGFEKVNFDKVVNKIDTLEKAVNKSAVEIKFSDGTDMSSYRKPYQANINRPHNYQQRDFGEYNSRRGIPL